MPRRLHSLIFRTAYLSNPLPQPYPIRIIAPCTPSAFAASQFMVFWCSETSTILLACWANSTSTVLFVFPFLTVLRPKNAEEPLYSPQWAPYLFPLKAMVLTVARCCWVFASESDIASLTSATDTGMKVLPPVLTKGSGALSVVPTIFGSVTTTPLRKFLTTPEEEMTSCGEITVDSSVTFDDTRWGNATFGFSGMAASPVPVPDELSARVRDSAAPDTSAA